jgi:hypothetical protein
VAEEEKQLDLGSSALRANNIETHVVDTGEDARRLVLDPVGA